MTIAGMTATQANRRFKAHFVEQLEAGRAQWEPILKALMMEFPSKGPGIEHAFSDSLGDMVEWIDKREMDKLGLQRFYVENKSYARGVEVDRDDLEDDNLGLYYPRIRSLAEKYWLHRFHAVRDLLNAAKTTLIWDGKYFADDDHPLADSSSVNDNITTDLMDEAAVQAAITQLRALKDSRGEVLDLSPTHLIFGPELEWTALDILKQERQSSGETNVMRGMMQPLMIPGLTTNTWAVADLSKVLKPFMFQNRRALDFVEMTDRTSQAYFESKQLQWGVDYRGRSYYAFYQTIVYSDATGS